MVAHVIHGMDTAATSAAEAPGGAAELNFRRFLFSSIVAGSPLHARPRIRPNGPEIFPQFRSQKTLTGKTFRPDHCAALGLAPAMTLMRESSEEQAARELQYSWCSTCYERYGEALGACELRRQAGDPAP